jgi:hypothetical protein
MILTSAGVAVFYLSYLVVFFLACLVWQFNELNGLVAIFLILVCLLFLYARFLEPNIIRIKRHKIKLDKKIPAPFRIAVFADLHVGLFTKSWFLKRAVKKINKLEADLILIPGDFVYNLAEKEIEDKFGCLKNLSAPIFAVLGGHDCGVEREKDVSGELEKILTKYSLKIIDNKVGKTEIRGRKIKIIGLSDIETRQPDYNLVKNLTDDDVNIVLAHNPDTAYEFPSYNMDLVVCGHTHGGQIRIYPFYKYAYKYIARMTHDFDKGLREFRGTKVFTTTGIGLDGLPFRFLMPPMIDILEIE